MHSCLCVRARQQGIHPGDGAQQPLHCSVPQAAVGHGGDGGQEVGQVKVCLVAGGNANGSQQVCEAASGGGRCCCLSSSSSSSGQVAQAPGHIHKVAAQEDAGDALRRQRHALSQQGPQDAHWRGSSSRSSSRGRHSLCSCSCCRWCVGGVDGQCTQAEHLQRAQGLVGAAPPPQASWATGGQHQALTEKVQQVQLGGGAPGGATSSSSSAQVGEGGQHAARQLQQLSACSSARAVSWEELPQQPAALLLHWLGGRGGRGSSCSCSCRGGVQGVEQCSQKPLRGARLAELSRKELCEQRRDGRSSSSST